MPLTVRCCSRWLRLVVSGVAYATGAHGDESVAYATDGELP